VGGTDLSTIDTGRISSCRIGVLVSTGTGGVIGGFGIGAMRTFGGTTAGFGAAFFVGAATFFGVTFLAAFFTIFCAGIFFAIFLLAVFFAVFVAAFFKVFLAAGFFVAAFFFGEAFFFTAFAISGTSFHRAGHHARRAAIITSSP
jgi:hypothetical protein